MYAATQNGMKKLLLLFIVALSLSDRNAVAQGDNRSIFSKIAGNLLADNKLNNVIAQTQAIIAEIKKNNVKYVTSKVMDEYWIGNTHYRTIYHYYDCDGPFNNVANRYHQTLNDLWSTHALCAMNDGVVLGFFASIIGKMTQCGPKKAGVGLTLASLLLTIAKNNPIGKVPYLSYPKLEPKDNYFGIVTNMLQFLYTGGSAAATYFGSRYVFDRIGDKLAVVSETIKEHNAK